MFFYSVSELPPASEGIKIINELLSEEQKELLTLNMGIRSITPLKQLTSLYGDMYCLYDLDEFETHAANIINRQLLDFEKLKQRDALIKEQANLDNYYQVSDTTSKGTKGVGIQGSSNGGSNNITVAAGKNRDGQAAYSKEFDMEQLWDEQNFQMIRFGTSLEDKHQLAKDWEFKAVEGQEDKDLTKYVAQEKQAPAASDTGEQPPRPEQQPAQTQPPSSEDEDEDMRVLLNTININSTNSVGYTKNNNYVQTGKRIESNDTNKTIKQSYVKARAIRALQEAQESPIRERIIQRFAVLFTDRPCQ